MNECTIQKTATISGKGLHTGQFVTLNFYPAPQGHGIQFKRVDIEGSPLIKALASNVLATNRSTTIGTKDLQISTVEHLLAAVVGAGIDNLLIEIDGPEVPILDGSAIFFMDCLTDAGLVEQDKARDYLVIEEPIVVKDPESGAELIVLPDNDFDVTVLIDFQSEVLGKQHASLSKMEDFQDTIAASRTFVFLHELEPLLDAGLIKGGDLDNAVVFVSELLEEPALERLAEKLNRPDIGVVSEGILNTTKLKYSNEPARHKLLDLVGDLALVGKRIKGKVIATKPGHKINTTLAKQLQTAFKRQLKTRDIPKYDPNKKPVFDSKQISKRLQHRFPFLLIDKIIELSDKHVVGIKNTTINEPFFPGHFPDNPVMPGVLQIEAMAQTGGLLVLDTLEDPHNWDTYFLRIDKARFRKMVVPGDTIIFKMELMGPIRRGLCEMKGRAYVGNTLVAEAELLAQIIKRK